MLGQQLSHYLIESEIGHGGMGTVYKARDTQLNRWVAIKAIHSDLLKSQPGALKRLREEAAVTASLDHPYICKVFEVLEDERGTLIVMEWINGKTLQERMSEGLSQADVLHYFTELAEALDWAHQQQFVHRDIKPSNVMITQHDHVKLMDFGLVKTLGRDSAASSQDTTNLTAPRTLIGTLRYMSPEQACGDSVDQRSDLFSLGVVMFEALTAKLPFRGSSHRDYLSDLLRGEPRRVSELIGGVSPRLEQVTMRCLAKDPAERFDNAGELLRSLRTIPAMGRAWQGWTGVTGTRLSWLLLLLIPVLLVLALLMNLYQSQETPVPREFPLRESLVTGPGGKTGSRISPNGEWISYILERQGKTALIVSRIDHVQPQTLVMDESISSHVWSPDGTQVAYLSERASEFRLRVIEAPLYPGRPVRDEVVSGPLHPRLIRWIGRRLYLEGYQSVWCFDLDSSELVRIAEKPPSFDFWRHFDVSPDAKKLVFSAIRNNQEDLFLSDLDGADSLQLTNDPANQEVPHWVGPEDRKVVFSSNRSGQMNLWQVDVESRAIVQLTSSPSAEYINDASRDGRLISFQDIRQESDIWSWSPRSGPRKITANTRLDLWPSHGGSRLAFQRSRPVGLETGTDFFDAEILLSPEKDGELTQPEPLSSGYAPRLSPDGRWLSFFRLGKQGPYRTELWIRDLQSGREQVAANRYQLSAVQDYPTELLANTVAWDEQGSSLFFVPLTETDAPRIVDYDPGTGREQALTLPLEPGQEIRDLYLSPSHSKLVFLHWFREDVEKQRFRLLVLDREGSGVEEWGSWVLDRQERVLVRGWASEDQVVVVHARSVEGPSESVEILKVGAHQQSQTVARIPEANAASIRLSPDRKRLFLTAVEKGIHNAFELSLASGALHRITSNQDEAVSFSAFDMSPSGYLFYARQQVRQDIGLLRYSP